MQSLAARGLIERDGFILLEGTPSRWRADDIGWLRDAFGLSSGVASESSADAPAASAPAPSAPASVDATTPPTHPWSVPPIPTAEPAACARSTYVLLAILPAFLGVFGVHNVVAGYTTTGIWQLVLSIFTIGSFIIGVVAPPCCCCGGLPVSLALFIWVIYEAITVKADARGRAML